jgi:hypothetical protein
VQGPSSEGQSVPGGISKGQALAYTTIRGGVGAALWGVRWGLTQPSPHGGWIVQHTVATIAGQSYNFWEAWKVLPGATSSNYADAVGVNDYFKGTAATVNASARFYESLTLPGSFAVENQPAVAPSLPATHNRVNPHLSTANATRAVSRSWRFIGPGVAPRGSRREDDCLIWEADGAVVG